MIDFSRIKMPKFVFKLEQKGLFKALGLHHARIALIPLVLGLVCSYFGYEVLGGFIASWGAWWYACREYGGQTYPPKEFEIMDFVSPAIVSLSYFPIYLSCWINLLNQ